MSQTTESVKTAVSQAIADSSGLALSFENPARYNEALAHTFERTVRDIAKLGNKLRILEVGSFTGVVSLALNRLGHHVTVSDMPFVIEDPALVALYHDEEIKTCPADLSTASLSLVDQSFDLIVFNEVVEHLNFNPIPLLREFGRLLCPGGRVYCATPNLTAAKNRWLILRGQSYINPVRHLVLNLVPGTGMSVGLHWREWTKQELIELFEAAGFDLESHQFGLVTPNRSGILRKSLVNMMYSAFPSLMPNQVAVFIKE